MRKNSLTLFALCATLLWVGAVHAKPGAPLRYTDNGDGTITDNNTKLMWEKKDQASGGLHNVKNNYRWSGFCSMPVTPCGAKAECPAEQTCKITDPQGTGWTIFQWVAQLNSGAGFAGHTDWRVPDVKELESIVDSRIYVATAFNTNCTALCTVLNCSCTQSSTYWSATPDAGHPDQAWFVYFSHGGVGSVPKFDLSYVRAVRSGL